MPKPNCASALVRAASHEDITREKAEEILSEIKNLAKQKQEARGLTRKQALYEAGKEYLGDARLEALVENRNKLLQKAAEDGTLQQIQRFDSIAGGLEARLKKSYTREAGQAGVEGGDRSVEYDAEAIAAENFGRLAARLEAAGLSREFQRGEIDELIMIELEQLTINGGKPGVTKNAAAKKIASAVHPILDGLVDMKNRNGAWIKKMKGYTVRQTHDKHLIRLLGGKDFNADGHREKSFTAWKAIILPLLDKERTFGVKDPEEFLRKVHEEFHSGDFGKATMVFADGQKKIVADVVGMDAEVGTMRTAASTAKSISASRVLHFKDAASSYAYMKQLGVHSRLYDAVIAQISTDSRNIALMRAFGPDAAGGFERVLKKAVKIARDTGNIKQIDDFKSPKGKKRIEDAWRAVSGGMSSATETPLGKFTDGMLTIQSMSKLFGAAFTSIGDVAFIWHAMRQMGVGRIESAMRVFSALPKGFEAFRPFAREGNERALFYRVNSVAVDALSGEVAARFGSLVQQSGRSGEFLRNANNMFFRMNFLSQWTESVKAAAFQAHASLMGEMAHLRMPELPDEIATSLRESGVTDIQWDAIRSGVKKIDGRYFLGADALDDVDVTPLLKEMGLKDTAVNRKRALDDLKIKTVSYFRSFQDRAVPSPGLNERIIQTGGGLSKDTLQGTFNALFWQFKTFPLTVYNKVIKGNKRMAEFTGNQGSFYMDVAMLVAATSVTGYLSGMFKDLLKGRSPKSLDNGKTWADAALRGGALGIYGDMLFQQYDNGFRKFTSTMAGPTAGSVLDPGFAGIQQLATGEFKKAGKTAYNMLGDNIPKAGAAHLLIKPAFDYTVGYSINEFFQPGWERRYRQRMKENGQELFGLGDPR